MSDEANALANEPVANDDVLPVEQDTPGTEPAAEGTPEAEESAPKPKRSPQERIDKAVRAQREAEREAEFWRSKATAQPAETPKANADAEPDPAEFAAGEWDPAYIKAVIAHNVRQGVAQVLGKTETERAQVARQEAFDAKVAAATVKHDDFHDVVFGGAQRGEWPCTNDMLEAMQEADTGADIAYHLATNPTEAQRIASLSPRAQVLAMGVLMAQLAQPTQPKPKTVSSAPPPTPAVRGASGQFKIAPDTDDFAAFEKQWG